MADEAEKKPEFVLNKKKPEAQTSPEQKNATASSPSEKKRVVIVRKKSASSESKSATSQKQNAAITSSSSAVPNQNTNITTSESSADEQKSAVHPVIKKNTDSSVSASQYSSQNNFQNANDSTKAQQNRVENKPAQTRSVYEINSERPNIKAGNLSDRPRSNYRNSYGNRDTGYQNRSYAQRRENGFSGTQARENYQNRERDNSRPNSGFRQQNGSFQNGRSGGFNRNSSSGGTGGRGTFSNHYQNGRSGFANRNGFTGKTGFSQGRTGFQNAPSSIPQENKNAGKKQFKGKRQVYNRKDKEDFFEEDELYGNRRKQSFQASSVPKTIDIMETVSVSDLARKMNLKAGEIIGKLMSMGMMVTINQSIDSDTATILASEYGCEVNLVSLYDETVIESERGDDSLLRIRPPIVTVMGHVDHGKTKTLDAIRKTNVAAGEAGGITQKIGAYQVKTEKGVITFLDTPGHEAFTMMRARGAQITDIVVLVVAADDGVMPQTLEAINHAKDAKVPIVVAVNKIDKPDANPEKVMTQLSEQGLTPEEWGGETQYVKISALKGIGLDDLLDAILLQAEILELKAQYDCRAEGKILESRVDQGRGVVASVMVQRGTLKVGDPFVAGIYSGRVRAMFNDRGEKISEAFPSMPVEVLGMDSMPNAGNPFQVTETERDARDISSKRQELKRFEAAKAVKKVTLDTLVSTIEESEIKELKVIIKADLQGSAEALKSSLEKLSTRDIRLVVIHSSAGAINESDVNLAAADDNSIIIGFNVRPTPKAKMLAEQEKVEIRKYNIIYKCVEEITQAMEGMLKPDTKEQVTGMVEVRNTFKVPKIGIVAGSYVVDGIVKKTCSVNLIRGGIVKFTGKIVSLKRYKDDVKEVKAGFECGIGLDNWQDIQIGDQLEVFEYIEVARKLGDSISLSEQKSDAKSENSEETESTEKPISETLPDEKTSDFDSSAR